MIFEFTWPDGNAFLRLRNAVFGFETHTFWWTVFSRKWTVHSQLARAFHNIPAQYCYSKSRFWLLLRIWFLENWMQFSIVSQIIWPPFCSCASSKTALHLTLMSLPSDSGCSSSAGSPLYLSTERHFAAEGDDLVFKSGKPPVPTVPPSLCVSSAQLLFSWAQGSCVAL